MKIDTHIHGEFSSDSVINFEALIDKAIQLNYGYICLTEHMDLAPAEIVIYGVLPLKKYQMRWQYLKEKYADKIDIGFGIELGETHLSMDLAEELFAFIRPDYLIGSLHVLKNHKNLSTPINFTLQDNMVMQYFDEIDEMIEKGGFDTLGHLGIYKREIPDQSVLDEKKAEERILRIFSKLIDKEICLEVNYSGYRSKLNSCIPEIKYLQEYYNMGGRLITIGSDSHRLEHFDGFYDQVADNLMKIGFKNIYYKKDHKWCESRIERVK